MEDGFQAKRVIKDWIRFYNTERPHTVLNKRSPNDAFFNTEPTQRRHETNEITSKLSRKAVLKIRTTSIHT
ncbi:MULTISPECIES: integrase core domain-containing protein [Pacificibacter]|uniref:integrase core domain-containing protein n=1 Tax=Pacificibacter TaxID=1042323 RepID=UPI001C09B82D|nr:integrase core domain-containing protein [Pacificibacter marinus]